MRTIPSILFALFSLTSTCCAIVVPNGTVETSTVVLPASGDTLLIEKEGAIVVESINGVDMDGAEDQTVLNQGTIVITGLSSVAISNNSSANATVINSGRILSTADNGQGLFNDGNSNVAFANQGLISTTGASASGISNSLGDTIRITNSGRIQTTGQFAIGIQNLQGDNAIIRSSGVISTAGLAAHGIFSNSSDDVAITNRGRIFTAGSAAHGILIQFGEDVVVTNRGLISTAASTASGIVNIQNNNAVITNSGRIQTLGDFGNGILNSGGLGVSNDVVIINSGLISTSGMSAHAISNSLDTGVADNVHIINSGTLRSAQASALEIEGVNPTVSLLRGSNLQGTVNVVTDPLNLNVETGLNLALTLVGSFGTLGIEAPFVLSNDTIGVIDPTGFALQADVLADLSDTVLDGVYRYRTAFRCQCQPCGCGIWAQGIGSYRERSRDKDFVGYDNWQGGFLMGYDRSMCGGNVGLFGGVSFGEAEVDERTQKAQTTSYVGGVSYERLFCNSFFGAALAVGYVDWDNERFVMNNLAPGGVERAHTDTGGAFVSPEVTLAQHFDSLWCSPTLSFTLRYAGLFLGDYSEKGSLTNLSVKDREIDLLTTRFEIALPYTAIRGACCWSIEPYLGVFGRYQVGGHCVNAQLLGETLHFESGGPCNLAAFLLGFRGIQSFGSSHLFLNLEGSFDTYSSSRILGEGGFCFNF